MLWVLGWRPKHAYLCTPWARKGVFGYLKWWCLKHTVPQNMLWVLGWRPKHAYLCTPWARKSFCIPKMVVFEMHNAIKWCLGSGAAPRTPIPLYPTVQQKCFWIPWMVMFEMHNAINVAWVLGWRPKHSYHCTLQASKSVLGYLG